MKKWIVVKIVALSIAIIAVMGIMLGVIYLDADGFPDRNSDNDTIPEIVEGVSLLGTEVYKYSSYPLPIESDISYSHGNASLDSLGIDIIYLDWINGCVELKETDDVAISLYEDGSRSEEKQVHYRVVGNELEIRYMGDNVKYSKNENKNLVISVPSKISKSFHRIELCTGSADVEVERIESEYFLGDWGSGDYSVSECSFAQGVFDTGSGDLTFNGRADEFVFDSGSGRLDFYGQSDYFTADSASGDIVCKFVKEPKKASFDTGSGDAEMYLPEKIKGFKVELDMGSGLFKTDFSVKQNEDEDEVIFGNGDKTSEIKFDSGSGNLSVAKFSQ